MDVPDERLGVRLCLGRLLGALGIAGERSFVVEAVQIAASFLELLDPFLGLAVDLDCQLNRPALVFFPTHHQVSTGSRKIRGPAGVWLTSAIIMWQSKVPRP
jgi:hypothetical protein